jgi:iron transport multicopper oxidase
LWGEYASPNLSSAFFNDITYVAPKVPTLYTALSAGDLATNPVIYGRDTNSFVLKHNQVIEIILNNLDPGKHPFHLREFSAFYYLSDL